MNCQADVPEAIRCIAPLLGCFAILLALVIVALTIWIWCKIFSKTGYSWAFGLLMLVPIANIVMLFVLAFSDWPIQKELQLLRQQQQKNSTSGSVNF